VAFDLRAQLLDDARPEAVAARVELAADEVGAGGAAGEPAVARAGP